MGSYLSTAQTADAPASESSPRSMFSSQRSAPATDTPSNTPKPEQSTAKPVKPVSPSPPTSNPGLKVIGRTPNTSNGFRAGSHEKLLK